MTHPIQSQAVGPMPSRRTGIVLKNALNAVLSPSGFQNPQWECVGSGSEHTVWALRSPADTPVSQRLFKIRKLFGHQSQSFEGEGVTVEALNAWFLDLEVASAQKGLPIGTPQPIASLDCQGRQVRLETRLAGRPIGAGVALPLAQHAGRVAAHAHWALQEQQRQVWRGPVRPLPEQKDADRFAWSLLFQGTSLDKTAPSLCEAHWRLVEAHHRTFFFGNGDLHPKNVLVSTEGAVGLVDPLLRPHRALEDLGRTLALEVFWRLCLLASPTCLQDEIKPEDLPPFQSFFQGVREICDGLNASQKALLNAEKTLSLVALSSAFHKRCQSPDEQLVWKTFAAQLSEAL